MTAQDGSSQPQQTSSKLTDDFREQDIEHPTFLTVVRLVWHTVRGFFRERPGQIIGSAFILIMLGGYHGELELLKMVWPAWRGPGKDLGMRPELISGIPWDNELISFWVGAILLVLIPILIIKFHFREPLANYGLGLPPPGRRKLAFLSFVALMAVSVPIFLMGTKDAGMQQVYPLFRPFSSTTQFLLYELTYLPFFIAIEFIFRGYLLFGLAGVKDVEVPTGGGGAPGVFYFGRYALLIQMLSYTAWHLGKPTPELWGTLVWGLVVGAMAYGSRSIWPIVVAHWLLNVMIDGTIVKIL